MSCGQIALRQLGIKVDKYYASEVDKFATAQTMLNFPDTIQLGDVCNIDAQHIRARRLTPTECARLQTVPEWCKWECSNTQQYKMLGNGWTIEVIVHILSFPDLQAKPEAESKTKNCGNCLLCIHTNLGSECSLTDNAVDDAQDGCIDYIPED